MPKVARPDGRITFSGSITHEEATEFVRLMNWYCAVEPYLREVEKAAKRISLDPHDPRHKDAREMLESVSRIRRQYSYGGHTSGELVQLQAAILRSDSKFLAPYVITGARVIRGGIKGAERTHGNVINRNQRKKDFANAFMKFRATSASDEEALGKAGRELGVSSRTVRRACEAVGVPMRRNSRKRASE